MGHHYVKSLVRFERAQHLKTFNYMSMDKRKEPIFPAFENNFPHESDITFPKLLETTLILLHYICGSKNL